MKKIAVIGLGYVGLPLALEFGKIRPVIGFDTNSVRIKQLSLANDVTCEIKKSDFNKSSFLTFTDQINDLKSCDIYIITVPTPILEHKQPDLTPLRKASEMVGSVISKGNIVIFESTVFPGATEEECVPVIEKKSGLIYNVDFYAGYSPERINPGDKVHTLTNIIKVTSGSTPQIADEIDELYGSIVRAGTYKVSSIKIAEAAKVIENTQRDVNIALINELAIIFNRLGIDTLEVLQAAETKWNFLQFRPGLVGGHCIGVDPYYLTYKAQQVGYHPDMILAGRRVNDNMGKHVASQLIKGLIGKHIDIHGARILILGFAFKENCTDFRNTKVVDIVSELKEYGVEPDIYDPRVDKDAASKEYGISLVTELNMSCYDAIVLAVAHDEFRELGIDGVKKLLKPTGILYDLKYIFDVKETSLRL